MIYSMTAFAREQTKSPFGEITFELRSVNQRYLDINFRLPEKFRCLEYDMRSIITQHLQRGKIDVTLNYTPVIVSNGIQINQDALQELLSTLNALKNSVINLAPIDPLALLNWPGITSLDEVDNKKLAEKILLDFTAALKSLKHNREKEGSALAKILFERIEACECEVVKVQVLAKQMVMFLREKFYEKIKSFAVDFDANRLEQEIVLQSQKADIAEELDRLTTHLTEVHNIIKQGGVVGRKLDFLMQELNREANTLSSKATSIEATNAAVELKVLIEQMREQIQNIE